MRRRTFLAMIFASPFAPALPVAAAKSGTVVFGSGRIDTTQYLRLAPGYSPVFDVRFADFSLKGARIGYITARGLLGKNL